MQTLNQKWFVYALLSAIAAAFVGIFGKEGLKSVDSNLATVIRSMVMTLFLVGVCTALGSWRELVSINRLSLAMLALSGVAGAVSWLFYFKAVQLSWVSKVAPIDKLSMPLAVVFAVVLLGERPSWVNWIGVGLITMGGYLAAMSRGG